MLRLVYKMFFQPFTQHFLGKTNDFLKGKGCYICERFVTFKKFVSAKIAKVLWCFAKKNADVCKHFIRLQLLNIYILDF